MSKQNMTIAIKAKDLTQAALKNVNTSIRKINASVYLAQKRFPKLTKAIRAVGRGARKLAGGLVTLTKRLATLSLKIGAVAAVAGAGIFTMMIKSSMSATDNLAKTARKIGTTTEALSKMRYAADLTGVSSTTMDMALQRFTRRTAEAAKGTGEAKDALKELGINARQMLKLPLEEQMLELSKAFEEVKNPADRVRLAMKLFDSEGVALVNTLGLGKDALQEMMGEAAALGIVMSTEAANGVEDANDAFSRLGYLFKGIRDQLTGALAPALEELATALKDKIQARIEAAGGSVEGFARILAVDIMQAIMTALSGLQKFINGVIRTFNEIKLAASDFTGFFKSDDEKNATQLTRRIEKLNEAMAERQKLIDKTDSRMGNAHELAQKRDAAEKESLEALLAKRTELGEVALVPELNFADDINGFLGGLVEKYNAVTLARKGDGDTDTGGDEDPNEKPKQQIKELTDFQLHHQDLLAQGDEKYLEFKKKNAVDKTKAVIDGLGEQLKGTGAISKKLGALEKAAAIKKALIATYESATKAFAAGGGFPFGIPMAALSIAQGMAQVNAIRAQSFDGGGYTGGGSRSGGVDGKGGFPAILHPQETVIDHTKPNMATIAAKLPSFDGGGYTGGIMPNMGAEKVVNNNNREQNNEGQVTINQTLNITTGIQSTVRAEIANLMPQITEAAKAAIVEARMRGGGFSQQLLGR